MNAAGWIVISRNITEMDGYFGEKFTRVMAWIDLLLLAEWRPERTFYIRGNKVTIKRGQLAVSVKELCERWRWSNKTVIERLKEFERDERISIEHSRLVNIITVLNYDRYQSYTTNSTTQPLDDEEVLLRVDTRPTQQTTQQSTQQTTQQTTQPINNIITNITSNTIVDKPTEKRSKPFIPPTVEEVRAYIMEKGYSVDAETFVDFYTSKGWLVGKVKMKDWKAAVRTWQKNRQHGTTNSNRQSSYDDARQQGDEEFARFAERKLRGGGLL